jgi:pyruvate-ferredoxin/flavodoxin oxidoreductase
LSAIRACEKGGERLQECYAQKSGRARYLRPGGVRVFICAWPEEEPLARMPARMRRVFARRRARLCIINATKIAVQAGLGKCINLILQGVFFKLGGVVPGRGAVELFKGSIKKLYGRRETRSCRWTSTASTRVGRATWSARCRGRGPT